MKTFVQFLTKRRGFYTRFRFYEAAAEILGLVLILGSFGFQQFKSKAQANTQFWRDQKAEAVYNVVVREETWPKKIEKQFPYENHRFQAKAEIYEEQTGFPVFWLYAAGSSLIIMSRAMAQIRGCKDEHKVNMAKAAHANDVRARSMAA